jgi:hypothetical protein
MNVYYKEIIKETNWTPATIPQPMVKTIKPRPYQIPCIEHAMVQHEYPANLMALPPGAGKALGNNQRVLTIDGWVPICKLRVGDFAIGSNGKPTKVTGVYPQGLRPMNSVRFIDGTQVICDDEHLWTTSNDKLRDKNALHRQVQTTEWLKDNYQGFSIPTVKPIESNGVDLPIDPSDIGMLHKTIRGDKEIPDIYLKGSLEQRRRLYEVLMSEGYFKTTSRALCLSICDLGRGLGLVVKYTTARGAYYIKELPGGGYKQITNIKALKPARATCISVDAEDSLFVTEGYNLTHNTISALIVASKLNQPIIIILRPSYMGVWLKSILQFTTADRDDITSIVGKPKLDKYLSSDEPSRRYTLISNKTVQSWIKNIEPNAKITPSNLLEKKGIGIVMFDETHQDLHFNYNILLLLNPIRILGISGTFITEDRYIKVIHNYMYPRENIYDYLRMNPYIALVNYNYKTLPSRKPVISNRGLAFYSHNQYEAWILKTPEVKKVYMAMVLDVINVSFINRRKEGERAIVYFSRIESIDIFHEVAEAAFPELKHLAYKQEVSYEELEKHDIIYATPMKASTAADIDGLILIINTISISSIQANVQLICRLRDLREETQQEMLMVQLINNSLNAHMKYKSKRVNQWSDILIKTTEVNKDDYL